LPKHEKILAMNDKGIWHGESCNEKLNVSPYNTFMLSRDIGLKVTLDGQGADEQLCGYEDFWYSYFLNTSKWKYEYWVNMLYKPINLRTALSFAFLNKEYFKKKSFISMPEGKKKLVKILDREYRLSRNRQMEGDYFENISCATNWRIKNSVQRLLRIMDYNSMAFSVETRQPFMDYRLVEFLNNLPSVYKLHNGWSKYIARMAFSDKLPDKIVWRKDKQGWPMPLKEWVNGDIGTIISKEIQGNTFLNENLNRHKIKFDDYDSVPLRFLFRLYNIARFSDIFDLQ
jgi:asparagine synthase (glutamine-hydrolysing)